MCYPINNIKNLDKWNWDGDYIIPEPVVPSSRPVVGYSKGHSYDIDVREFLTTERNAVIREELDAIRTYIKNELKYDSLQFNSRQAGSFDFRAFAITNYISEKIEYYPDSRNTWQFPDETVAIKRGDCEDRALLLASLLISSGISSFNVRVALGNVKYSKGGEISKHDHVWVMYKNEFGKWKLLEPLHLSVSNKFYLKNRPKPDPGSSDQDVIAEYTPYYLFNDCHLWLVYGNEVKPNFKIDVARRWSSFNPAFAGEVHKGILEAALFEAADTVKNEIKRYYSRAILGIAGPLVDKFDRGEYDPAMHCDNCFIDEGWNLINKNLLDYKGSQNLDSFFAAAHTIADFYAHSSYCNYAGLQQETDPKNDYITLYTPDIKQINPVYDSVNNFDLASGKFSVNKEYWKLQDKKEIPGYWNSKIISGRYAQTHDTWKGLSSAVTEGILSVMPDKYLNTPNFDKRGWVPHHNEIAVDDASISSSHVLYPVKNNPSRDDRTAYQNQFKWRRNSAIRHIRTAYNTNSKKPA